MGHKRVACTDENAVRALCRTSDEFRDRVKFKKDCMLWKSEYIHNKIKNSNNVYL